MRRFGVRFAASLMRFIRSGRAVFQRPFFRSCGASGALGSRQRGKHGKRWAILFLRCIPSFGFGVWIAHIPTTPSGCGLGGDPVCLGARAAVRHPVCAAQSWRDLHKALAITTNLRATAVATTVCGFPLLLQPISAARKVWKGHLLYLGCVILLPSSPSSKGAPTLASACRASRIRRIATS